MSVKIQDWNRVASNVVLVAQGPDGKPALLSADKPAGAIAEKFTYTSTKVTKIEFFSTYDPATETGTLLATKNIRYTGDEVKDIYWT
jgi:hypothetical protein